jgi:hypothetical protein
MEVPPLLVCSSKPVAIYELPKTSFRQRDRAPLAVTTDVEADHKWRRPFRLLPHEGQPTRRYCFRHATVSEVLEAALGPGLAHDRADLGSQHQLRPPRVALVRERAPQSFRGGHRCDGDRQRVSAHAQTLVRLPSTGADVPASDRLSGTWRALLEQHREPVRITAYGVSVGPKSGFTSPGAGRRCGAVELFLGCR